MTRKRSDETTILRDEIDQLLQRATDPMTNMEVHDKLRSLGLSSDRVARELAHMYRIKKYKSKMRRVPAAKGMSTWAYFYSDVVTLAPAQRAAVDPVAEPPVNAVKPVEEFTFNPVEFAASAATPSADIPLPPGVTIKVDLH